MLKRRFVWIPLALSLSLSHPAIARSTGPVAEVEGLQMFSDFWLNLHHFLYVSAWARRADAPSQRRLAMPLPADHVILTKKEQTTWDAAVSYYNHEFASKDLLFDDGLNAINNGLAGAKTLTGLPLAAEHRRLLEAAAPIYRRYWWPQHDAANRAWIGDVARRTAPVARQIIDRLTSLYGVKWFDTPVRVDVVRVGKSQGAYTTVVPRVHIIVASADASYAGWAGTEMLFHESSHGLIQNVRAAVDQAMTAAGKNPHDLWHVVLFYISEKSRGRRWQYAVLIMNRICMPPVCSHERGRCFADQSSKRCALSSIGRQAWTRWPEAWRPPHRSHIRLLTSEAVQEYIRPSCPRPIIGGPRGANRDSGLTALASNSRSPAMHGSSPAQRNQFEKSDR